LLLAGRERLSRREARSDPSRAERAAGDTTALLSLLYGAPAPRPTSTGGIHCGTEGDDGLRVPTGPAV